MASVNTDQTPENKPVVRQNRAHAAAVARRNARISFAALQVMLLCILSPCVYNAIRLHEPTPSQLLINICVSVFASVVYLWILDVTDVLRFRNEWVSKSIYGAAIASILGTSVGVYKDYFQADKYPFRGKWNLVITARHHGRDSLIADNIINLSYSENSQLYYGYSNINETAYKIKGMGMATEIRSLSDKLKTLQIVYYMPNGDKAIINQEISDLKAPSRIVLKNDSNQSITLTRPNF